MQCRLPRELAAFLRGKQFLPYPLACFPLCGQDLGDGGGEEMDPTQCGDDAAVDMQSKPPRSLPQALGDAQARHMTLPTNSLGALDTARHVNAGLHQHR